MSQSPDIDRLKKKTEQLIEQPNPEQLHEFENELGQYLENSQESSDIRAKISQMKSEIYKKRAELEHKNLQTLSAEASATPNESEPQVQGYSININYASSDDAMAHGDAAYYSGKIHQAAIWYERALDLDPNRERARQRLRDIREGHIPQLAVPPEAGSAYGRALSLYRRGRYMNAIAEVQKALDLMDGVFWKDAQDLLNESFSAQEANELFEEALKEEDEGQWTVALRSYDAALAISPDNPLYGAAREKLKDLMSKVNAIRKELRPGLSTRELPRLADVNERIKSLERQSSSKSIRELRADFNEIVSISLRAIKADIQHALAEIYRKQDVEITHIEIRKIQAFADLAEALDPTDHELKEISESIEAIEQEVNSKQQKYERLLESAELAIQAAQFELALEALKEARNMFHVSSQELDEFTQTAQTGFALQKKYYELMQDGDHYMENEDYESAMKVFHEADTLVWHLGEALLPLDYVRPKDQL